MRRVELAAIVAAGWKTSIRSPSDARVENVCERALTSVVSTKGQVILPKFVLERRDWPPGTKRVVEEITDGVLLRRAPQFDAKPLSAVFAMLKTDGRRQTVEDMDSAVLKRTRP